MATKQASKPKAHTAKVIAPTTVDRGKYQLVELKLIERSKTNPRKYFDDAALKELAESIREHGVVEPITLRPDGKTFELVAGERRLRASKLAGRKEIPAIIKTLDDKAVLEIQVIENLQRVDISPLEEADGYDALIKKHGYTTAALAAKVGKSQSYIEKRRELVNLCEDARARFLKNELTLGHALLLARISDVSLQEKALSQAGGLSTSNLKSWIDSHVCTSLSGAPFSITDPDLLPIAGACTACPYNTGVASELFDDFKSGTQCTKPSCFNKKVTAHWKNVTAAAKEKGQEALSRTESEKIFSRPGYGTQGSTVRYDSGYVMASDKCDDHPKKLTLAQIVGNRMLPILALDKNQKVRKIYRLTDLNTLLKEEKWFKKKKAASKSNSGGHQSNHDWEKDNRRRSFLNKSYSEAAMECIHASKASDFELFRMGILADLAGTNNWNIQSFVKAKCLPEKKGAKPRERMQAYLQGLDFRGLILYYFEALLPNNLDGHASILSASGVDLEAFKKSALEAFNKAEIELAAAKKKGATAPVAEPEEVEDFDDEVESDKEDAE